MAKKMLTSYFLEEHLKKGWCVEDFAKHFEVDKEGFYRLLEKVTKNSRYVNNYKNRLANNEKKRKEHKIDVSNESAHFKDTTESFDTAGVPKEEKECGQEELLKLQAEESTLRENIEGGKKQAESLKASEEKAKKKIEELNNEIANISKSLGEISNQISQNSLKLAENEEKLKKVQEEIKQLTKIIIFAYSDGKIEIDGDAEVPGNWSDVFTKLIQNDSVEQCTVKQIKQFAKIITISKSYEDRIIEVSWDDLNMQGVFESLK